jgi:hypothetical protein
MGGGSAAGGGSATGGGAATGGGSATGGGATGGGSVDAGPTGTATLSGPLAFTVKDARAVLGVNPDDGGTNFGVVQVAMASVTLLDFCNGTAPDGTFESAFVGVNSGGATITPGVVPVGGPQGLVALGTFEVIDGGNPMPLPPFYQADAGTITVTTADMTHIVGTFDVSLGLPDGGHSALMGSFDAPYIVCSESWLNRARLVGDAALGFRAR